VGSAGVLQFLASSPRGLADLLARELTELGAENLKERSAGVAFCADLRVAYRACLESRIANRIFLELARFEARDAQAFYEAARGIPWAAHLAPGATLACEFTGRHPNITHTHFGALKLKDAIVDAVRDATGARPDVALERPGLRIHAHAQGQQITVSLDLSGESLHRRGYRGPAGEAPLKENVAAGLLLRAGWAELAAVGAQFLDPMCGSGTLAIEAALIAAGRAPNLARGYFGFLGWRGHDPQLWGAVQEEARARVRAQPARTLVIRGRDGDSSAIHDARANAARAGVGSLVHFEVGELADAAPAASADAAPETPVEVAPELSAEVGLVAVNPPYGVRLEDHERALALHRELGHVLRGRFRGWHAAVLIGAPHLGRELGLRAWRTHALWNGGIECRLLRLRVEAQSEREPGRLAKPGAKPSDSPGARMFANRLGKNLKRLRGWAARTGVSCYRLYDADMPEYAFAIDLYRSIEPDLEWLYVQEYAAPAEIEQEAVRRRRSEALSTLPQVTGVPGERIRLRTRRRTRRGDQYRKIQQQGSFHVISEGGLRFEVNFDDYLDTGLFLDHRVTRDRLRARAQGGRFLNLFAYTGTATVYAVAGGAAASTSVDLSRTYLDWTQRNLELNGPLGRQHELVQADCREWLREGARAHGRYGLIFLDPPTFSNSKRMQGVLDVERDHPQLIESSMSLLEPGGLLVFSTNAQRFRLDAALRERHEVRDISAATLPHDFERNPRIHHCFELG
jgi:23S rRNA (guanine2445-N2)-methyltransferase / 23S rRNA (guanine2069-N7)-methyltransferase